jgi:hypothetical protein
LSNAELCKSGEKTFMPLVFQSQSHGPIAFGFFNIETDMLLLDSYFFFCTDFCKVLSEMAYTPEAGVKGIACGGYFIADPVKIGDLMGAISGSRHTGFIGALYRKYPFPEKQEDFRQNPEGFRTRAEVEALIEKYGRPLQIQCMTDAHFEEISIGPYRFTRKNFQELIKYLWRGGYPRWKDEQRPFYILDMKDALSRSASPLFAGLFFSS